ncbi:hypothetical protein HPB50_024849 [Hyalomma asiaticum]|uniref:Uncharacterized protein n=1 Tax=Hyalomma asiaticum TaxID=266040 RepID=A0ACB7SAC4_HYAAI|nr:hypothetical protein HPB50_024849 [Hyalomma asiaticum]
MLALPCSVYSHYGSLPASVRAKSGADAPIVFDGHGFSPTQTSSPAFGAGICSDGGSDSSCSDPSAHGFSWLQTTSHSRFNQKQLVSSMKLAVVLLGVDGREDWTHGGHSWHADVETVEQNHVLPSVRVSASAECWPEEDIPRKLEYMEFVCHAPSEYFKARKSPYPVQKPPGPECGFIWTRIGPQIRPVPTQEEVFGTA